MLHDDFSITMAARIYTADVEVRQQEAEDAVHVNDDLDDVFGSAPGTPAFPTHDDLHNTPALRWKLEGNAEISDIPRLQEKHETEGYRDGVAKGKAESVQKGFDEGYNLGATLGLRIGKILGLLEGVYHAVNTAARDSKRDGNTDWEVQRERVEQLWKVAKEELRTQNVFGKEWWGTNGVWTFEVPGEGEGMEVLFPDVAGAHPLVRKWEKVVDEEVERWGLDLGVLEREDDEKDKKDIEKTQEAKDEPASSTAPKLTKELAW